MKDGRPIQRDGGRGTEDGQKKEASVPGRLSPVVSVGPNRQREVWEPFGRSGKVLILRQPSVGIVIKCPRCNCNIKIDKEDMERLK